MLIGGLGIFDDEKCDRRLKKILNVKFPHDQVVFCMASKDTALIVLSDRLIHTFLGMRVDTIFYSDIIGISVVDNFLNREIDITTLNGVERIGLKADELKIFQPYASRIIDLWSQAKSGTQNFNNSHTKEEILKRLERLAALHRNGDLTDDEFVVAKNKLLG